MCQSGNGFKNTSQRDFQPRERKLDGYLSLMKPRLRLAPRRVWLWVAIEPKHREILQD